MLPDKGGRIRSRSRDEFTRLLAELPPHLAEMARFSVATGLRQANVTRLQWKQISLERWHLWVEADQHKNGNAHSVCAAFTASVVVAFCLEPNRLVARMTFCRMSRALLVQINGFGLVLR